MVDDERQAGAEIEITQEMIEAGVKALALATISCDSSDASEDLVEDVFVAMIQFAKLPQC